jgi:hypothetical protein
MDQFLAEVTRREDAKRDYLVTPKAMMMTDDDSHMILSALGKDGRIVKNLGEPGQEGGFGINTVAHGQIAEKLGIPKKFYDEIAVKSPGLRAYNVNALLANSTAKHLVRTMDGNIRGVLSDRFKPIDNFLVLQAALPVIRDYSDLEVVASQLSDTRMYLQLTFPRIQGEIVVGDKVQAGVILANSEVGYGAVDVKSVIFRLRCRNGMVGESVIRQYHAGRRVGEDIEDYDIFSDETMKAELESFRLRLRDILKASITQAAFEKSLISMKKAAGMELPVDAMEGVVENVTRKYNLTQDEGKKILSNLWKEKDTTRWGLANAVTALVHDTEDADRQYDIERAGYDLMVAPQASWGALVKVA